MTTQRLTGSLRFFLSVCIWLLLSGLLLLLVLQTYEFSRGLSHLLFPTNFEQEVASRTRPMLVSNSVLLVGVVLWLGVVVVTMNRLLAMGQNQPSGSLGSFCVHWFGTVGALLALLWVGNRLVPFSS